MVDQEFNIKFVAEVEKHESLYNYKLPEYSRKEVTEKAWQEVAARVNMSAGECKEKWRNLRTVFARKLKPTANGAGAKKKAYYLENAMQFCLPFMQTSVPSSTGNLPPVPLNPIVNDEVVETASEDGTSQLDFSYPMQSAQAPSTQPSCCNSSAASKFQHNVSDLSQQRNDRPVQFSSSTPTKRKLTVKNKSAAYADHCVAEYFKTKKAKLDDATLCLCSQKIDRQQGLELFLLSLIPDLEDLSNSQIKLFKRRVFSIMDEISSRHQP